MLRRGRCFALSYWASTPIGTSISATVPRFFFLYKLTVGRVKLKLLKMKKVMFTAFAVGLCLSANVMAQVPSYVPTNGLVGYWPFNGNANDESGNGNNGTVNGATLTTDRFGNVGKAYSFDGVGNYIKVPSNNSLNSNSISVAGWFNLDVLSNNIQGLVSRWNQLNNPCYNFSTSIDLVSKFTGACTQYPSTVLYSTSLDSGIWIHFTYVHDANSGGSIYLNGILVNNNNTTGSICLSSNDLIFGAQNNLSNTSFFRYLDGKLDDIGYWNRALTDQEISDLYNANICYDYVTVTDTLVINTGITGYNPITYLNTLKIWPNPSNDHITIDAGNLATMNGYSIKIEDAQGQQVFQNAVNQQQFYVDITNWGGNGLYFVRIIDPQGNTVDIKKIVLQ